MEITQITKKLREKLVQLKTENDVPKCQVSH
jgi:hypothetical protein